MRASLILCICLLALGAAAPAAEAGELPDFHSAGFGLQGTNGYQIGFSAFSERPDGRGDAHVVVFRGGRGGSGAGYAIYATSAVVSDDYVKADFGPFGKVDMAILPSPGRADIPRRGQPRSTCRPPPPSAVPAADMASHAAPARWART
jgi:hypothetical protein